MRKGKLLVIEESQIKPGDICFDTETKRCVEIVKIDDAGIFSMDAMTTAPQNPIKASEFSKGRFVNLVIEDEITGEIFPLDQSQQAYIFKNESRHRLQFFTCTSGDKQIAVTLSKDIKMLSITNKVAPIVDMYGEYVASQKAIKEPAKRFRDWFFSVSV